MRRVILYADDRRALDREIIALFDGLPRVVIPTSGGVPFAVYGCARWDYGRDDFRALVELVREDLRNAAAANEVHEP